MHLVCCAFVIKNEIDQGLTQKDIAQTYAMAIMTHAAKVEAVDWPAIHAAIEGRWSKSAVERVKEMAWRIIEGHQDAQAKALAERN